MNIFQFARVLWARRLIIAVSTVCCVAAGLLAVLLLPKVYVATTRVMLDVNKPDPLGSEEVNAAFARTYVASEAEAIADYRVGARAAQNLGWDDSPEFKARYAAYKDAQAANGEVLDFDHWAAQQITQNIDAAQFQQTNVIQISYSANDSNTAAQMANAVRQAYADENGESKRNDAGQAADWITRQLGEIVKQRDAAEQRLIAFQRANGVVLLDKGGDVATAGLAAVAGQAPNVGSTTIAGGGGNPNAAQIAALDAKIATESTSLGPNHPVIQDLRRQRAALAAAPVGAPSRVVNGPSLSSAVAAASSQLLAKSDKIEQARSLQDDVNALNLQYQQMVQRAAQLRQAAQAQDFSVVMLDAATPPHSPTSPKIPLILIGSFGLGLGLGVLVALMVEFMRRRVRGVDDVAAVTTIPIIGVINPPPAKLALVA